MNALKQMIPNVAKDENEAVNLENMVNTIQKQAEKYVVTGVSPLGLCTAKLSLTMNVREVKIDRQKFAEMQSSLRKEQNPNDVACAILEEEMLAAMQNAMNKIMKSAEKSIAAMPKKSKLQEDIGEFMG